MIKINTIKLINGDCLDKLKQIKDKSINLVLIDPPYNISKADWDKWKTVGDYVQFMGQVFLECQRVLKDNGSFYFFHNDFEQMAELQVWIKKNTKFVFNSLITIDKLDNIAMKDLYGSQEHFRNYLNINEYALFYTLQDESEGSPCLRFIQDYLEKARKQYNIPYSKLNELCGYKAIARKWMTDYKQPRLIQKDDYNKIKDILSLNEKYEVLIDIYNKLRYTFNAKQGLKNTWQYYFKKEKQYKHKTQKPVQLIRDIITYSSNEEDIVLDCFMGSGTCAEACLVTNRNFIGIELDDTYFETCKNRVNTYIKDNNLQDIHIEIS